ncbi:MAG: hypothetical protein ACI8TQ_003459 [Planctomycetota bacterium]|jgi:hypothetical protein
MWSGPRNISTALMRSFESRASCRVIDEPLYSHYLKVTGLDHPMAAEIIEHHESDWRKVVDELSAPLADGDALYYQKQMSHHLTPDIERDWMSEVTHAFLIRDPAEMLISLNKKLPSPTALDTGLLQQLDLYRSLSATGERPPVIDSRNVLENPRGVLTKLCEALGIAFEESMLSWAPGKRDSDGCWADHWYGNVFETTQFGTWKPRTEALPPSLEPVLPIAQAAYDELFAERLTAN